MVTIPPPSPPDRALVRSRVAVGIAFLVNGAILATWASRIPEVMAGLGLSAGELGIALLAEVAGVLIAMQVAGPLCGRLGSRPVTLAGIVVMSVAVLGPALARSLPSLIGALLLVGIGNGTLDVAMNAHGVTVERRYGRPILTGFHALWSVGGIVGALAGGLAAEAGLPPLAHFALAGAVLGGIGLVATRRLLPASADAIPPAEDADGAPEADAATDAATEGGAAEPRRSTWGIGRRRRPGRRRPPMDPRVLVLGLIGFACLGEGAAANWSAVYLRELGASPGLAAAGWGAFSLAMAIGRLLGDRLNARYGAVRLGRASGILAACGLAAGLAVGTPAAVVVGFALHGAGLACIVPLVFSAAGRIGGPYAGTALARVATFSYAGPLIGPVVIGAIADRSSLTVGLLLPVALAAMVALAAGNLRPATPDPAGLEARAGGR